jgi:hypothetical protein
MRIDQIQQQIGSGEYRVDTHAVAEAIIRRLMAGHGPVPTPAAAVEPAA